MEQGRAQSELAERLEASRVGGQRSRFRNFLARLVREKPLGTIGLAIIVLMCLMALFADLIAPYGFQEQDLSAARLSYSWDHLLGTDQLGRDLFSRVVYGARVSLQVGIYSVLITLVGATLLGIVTGYYSGTWVDNSIQRVVDGFMTIPYLVFLLFVMSILGPGLMNIVIALSIEGVLINSRIIRAQVLSTKENTYMDAGRAIGASTPRLMILYILPNIMAPIIIIGTVSLGLFILAEASISYLGFGIPPPFPTWGGMLTRSGLDQFYVAPHLAIWPGFALSLAVFGFNMFGDALRDLLDPRLRGT